MPPPQQWAGGNPDRWDHKTVDLADGLLKNITDSTFLVALNICSYALSFTKLSLMLHTERTVIKYLLVTFSQR